MNRTIFRSENNSVLSLPKELLDILAVGEGEAVSVTVDQERRQVVISPITGLSQDVDAEFARQVAEFIDEYRPALEALAR